MFWLGLLLCAACGVEIGGVAAGLTQIGDGPGDGVVAVVVCANLAPWTCLAGFAALAGARSRIRAAVEAATFGPLPPLVPALARIESSRALGEGPDIPLSLDLTVAPAERPAYRVEARARVNLVDLSRFQAGQNVVVDHDPEHPWRVEVRQRPEPQWAQSARDAVIDSVPTTLRVAKPDVLAGAGGAKPVRGMRAEVLKPGLLGILAGLAASVVMFWGSFGG